MPVAALRSPPTASISSAIWRALRRLVPLNAMCSRKCEMPCSSGASLPAAGRDPDAERCRLQMRHRVGHHDQSGRETGNLDTHAAAPSRATRLTLEMKLLDRRLIGGRERFDVRACAADRRATRAARGRTPQAASTAAGNLAGCAVDEHDHRRRAVARVPSRRPRSRPRCAGRRGSRPRGARCGWWRRFPARRHNRR